MALIPCQPSAHMVCAPGWWWRNLQLTTPEQRLLGCSTGAWRFLNQDLHWQHRPGLRGIANPAEDFMHHLTFAELSYSVCLWMCVFLWRSWFSVSSSTPDSHFDWNSAFGNSLSEPNRTCNISLGELSEPAQRWPIMSRHGKIIALFHQPHTRLLDIMENGSSRATWLFKHISCTWGNRAVVLFSHSS